TGVSIVRPLFVEFPDDGQAWDRWDEFFYGQDVVVGAVWQKGQRQMPMYLPAGEWRDAWNPSDVVRGAQTVTVDTPLERIPIYVRSASTINLGDLPALGRDSWRAPLPRPISPRWRRRCTETSPPASAHTGGTLADSPLLGLPNVS